MCINATWPPSLLSHAQRAPKLLQQQRHCAAAFPPAQVRQPSRINGVHRLATARGGTRAKRCCCPRYLACEAHIWSYVRVPFTAVELQGNDVPRLRVCLCATVQKTERNKHEERMPRVRQQQRRTATQRASAVTRNNGRVSGTKRSRRTLVKMEAFQSERVMSSLLARPNDMDPPPRPFLLVSNSSNR